MRQPQLVAFQVHVIADNLSELCLGMYHTSRHPSFLDRADGLASWTSSNQSSEQAKAKRVEDTRQQSIHDAFGSHMA